MPIVKNINESDTLVIAVTGINHRLTLSVEKFFEAAGLADKSSIIITDHTRRFALGGIAPEYPSLPSLVEYLRNEISRLSVKKVIVTGTSAGASTALLLGHLLKADYVVAFSPYPYLGRAAFARMRDPALYSLKKIIDDMEDLPDNVKKFFDLREVLSSWNGVTRYYVHVSRYHKWDRRRAAYLKDLPQLEVILHPYRVHSVSSLMAKSDRLSECFTFPYRPARRPLKDALLRLVSLTLLSMHKLHGYVRGSGAGSRRRHREC